VKLVRYADADLQLTEALETDPEVMGELGGPIPATALPAIHERRLKDRWWLKIVQDSGAAVGMIGIWEKALDGARIHETGWMVLPAFQGRGIASEALKLLIELARVEPQFERIHAFPPVTNAPSNALCRKFGFTLHEKRDFSYAGRPLRCNHWSLALEQHYPSESSALADPRE
jgi:RimJ/RimL family protein N-acetyltransferase